MKLNMLLMAAFLFSDIAVSENSVTFEGEGSPGFLTIEGKGGKVKGSLDAPKNGKHTGKFEVDLKAFDTGIDLRNTHMKTKYLEVDKYPTAKLVLNPVMIPKGGYFNWTGDLTLHGVTKNVSGVAFLDNNQIEAKFNINTPDFKLKKAIYMGVGLEDKIGIVVRLDYPQ